MKMCGFHSISCVDVVMCMCAVRCWVRVRAVKSIGCHSLMEKNGSIQAHMETSAALNN